MTIAMTERTGVTFGLLKWRWWLAGGGGGTVLLLTLKCCIYVLHKAEGNFLVQKLKFAGNEICIKRKSKVKLSKFHS